jgi:hypothetical protein
MGGSQAPTKGVVELVVHYYQPEVATFSHGGQITVLLLSEPCLMQDPASATSDKRRGL